MKLAIAVLLLSVLSGCAAKKDCLAMDLKTRQCVRWGVLPK